MFVYPKPYDVIVLGAGHAGIEAALASARMGCQTLIAHHQRRYGGSDVLQPGHRGVGQGAPGPGN